MAHKEACINLVKRGVVAEEINTIKKELITLYSDQKKKNA